MSGRTQTAELLGEIGRARALVVAAVANASAGWDATPAPEAWSVMQVARHVVENDYFFGDEVARVLGLEPAVRVEIDCATPGAAVDALAGAARAVGPALETVMDEHLAREWQGGMSLADLLVFYAEHTSEHLAQIEAAPGAPTLVS